MRAYRSVWDAAVAILVATGVLAGATEVGWRPLLVAITAVAVLGGAAAAAWVPEPWDHRGRIGALALWCGAGAALFLGLPPLTGRWTLPVLAVVALVAPPVVDRLTPRARRPAPVRSAYDAQRLRDRDLEQRWRSTEGDLWVHRGDVRATLALVEERALLLDEVERRDPVGFDAVLVSTGWREPQGH